MITYSEYFKTCLHRLFDEIYFAFTESVWTYQYNSGNQNTRIPECLLFLEFPSNNVTIKLKPQLEVATMCPTIESARIIKS